MKYPDYIKKYKYLAILGIILMGIGSFMVCLSNSKLGSNTGTFLLCLSIVISIIGFSKWQP